MEVKINQAAVASEIRKLSSALHKAEEFDLKNGLRDANKRIAQDAAEKAKRLAPMRTGYLRRWIRGQWSFYRARIAVGTKTKATYGLFVELGIGRGWSSIGAQRMAHKAFEQGYSKYIRWLGKAVDKAATEFNKSQ